MRCIVFLASSWPTGVSSDTCFGVSAPWSGDGLKDHLARLPERVFGRVAEQLPHAGLGRELERKLPLLDVTAPSHGVTTMPSAKLPRAETRVQPPSRLYSCCA
jgi:hypothetical protein